jgi:hypothetical protein
MSHNGGYALTTSASTRLFNDIKYLLSPNRSNHRRQKANVPKLFVMVLYNCFALAFLIEKKSSYGFLFSINVPDRSLFNIKILHIMRHFHIIVHYTFTSTTECFNCINFSFLNINEWRNVLFRY